MEQALISEYNNKYHLAHSSPFLKEPLLSELGQLALNDKAHGILNGDFVCPAGVKKHTRRFIEHLKMDSTLLHSAPNPIRISMEDSNTFWSKMTERVSSSPSTRHIGCYKAAIHNTINAKVQAEMMSLPYETGFPLPRTTNCVNVSLVKKGKGIKPSDLRTIWLMEADLNAGAKVHFV